MGKRRIAGLAADFNPSSGRVMTAGVAFGVSRSPREEDHGDPLGSEPDHVLTG
jgi:hypothetical protein